MSTITIAISDDMKEWLNGKTRSGEFADSSAYVSDLIRRDQERSAKIAAMQTAVDAGLASGLGNRTADELFEAAQRQARTVRGG
jgi:antitoxin ParD1/3/4